MKKRLTLFFISILFLQSCCKRSAVQILTNGHYKYWYIHYLNRNDYYYYFDIRGKWLIYIAGNNNFYKWNGGDEIVDEKWTMPNDSCIELGGMSFAIKKMTKEQIILSSGHGLDTLRAAKDDEIPEEINKYNKMNFR